MRNVLRLLKVTGITLVLLVAVITIVVRVQERATIRRAQALLADVRAIETGKATWSDAQAFMERWKKWGSPSAQCTQNNCHFTATLAQVYGDTGEDSRFSLLKAKTWVLLRHALGGDHPATIRGEITVADGHIWGRGFATAILQRDATSGKDYLLVAEARTAPMPIAGFLEMADHPEFNIGQPNGCTFCVEGWLHFTPFADAATISRLMEIRLDCLHRSAECHEQKDIMPAAWTYDKRGGDRISDAEQKLTSCAVPLDVRARDANTFATGAITTVKQVAATASTQARLDLLITPDAQQPAGGMRPKALLTIHAKDANDPALMHSDIAAKAGSRVVMLLDKRDVGPIESEAWSCLLAADTEQNLRLIRNGFQQRELEAKINEGQESLWF